MDLVIGIIGYASESSALLISSDGSLVARKRVLSGMEWRDSMPGSPPIVANLLLEELAESEGLSVDALVGRAARIAVALSGLDRRFQRGRFQQAMHDAGIPGTKLVLGCLAQVAHVGAFLGEPGIVLRCGHGSSVFLRSSSWNEGLSGGWGGTIGDHGSGLWLGRKALTTLARVRDCMANSEEIDFSAALLSKLLPHRPSDLTRPFERMESERAVGGDIAVRKYLTSIAATLLQLAETGEPHANRLLHRALDHLIDTVHGAATSASALSDRLPICVRGGLIEASPHFSAQFYSALASRAEYAIRPTDGRNGLYSPFIGIGLSALGFLNSRSIHEHRLAQNFLKSTADLEWSKPSLERLP